MSSTAEDQKLVESGEVSTADQPSEQDFDEIAESIYLEYKRRKTNRRGLERHWKEIDRQLKMQPINPHKRLPSGRIDVRKRWMAEMELPLQAQTLEVLTADARRLIIPPSGSWYKPTVELSDEYESTLTGLELNQFNQLVPTGDEPAAKIAGDTNDIANTFLQHEANILLTGIHDYFRSMYDFDQSLDLINAEAFKYSIGIGRCKLVTRPNVMSMAKGSIGKTVTFPALIPVTIKNTYLDDSPHATMVEGEWIDAGVIQSRQIKLKDLQVAASLGSQDPNSDDGGWKPENIENVDSDSTGHVLVLDFEGDIVVPRASRTSTVLRGVLFTIFVGKSSGKYLNKVIRFRYRQAPFNSYLQFPYHQENVEDTYATSPLMKGRPIQMAAADGFNRLMDSASLKVTPPVGYDRTDMYFAQMGGPAIAPYAHWPTTTPVSVHDEVGGDPVAMANIFTTLVQLYYDVTGVQQPRLGQQTVSHTTAFAKGAELERGVIRTVDYVTSILKGPLTKLLHMEKHYLKETLGRRMTPVYIDGFKAWMEVNRDVIPDNVWYNATGAGEPIEQERQRQIRFAAAQQAVQLDILNVQLGQTPNIDIGKLQDAILAEGGWTDVDAIKTDPSVSGSLQNTAQTAGDGDGTALPAAIQALAVTGGGG